jgi:hypothetical protein
MAEGAACSARKPRVLLCATGSVATVKVPQLAVALSEFAEVSLPSHTAASFAVKRIRLLHVHFNKHSYSVQTQSS